MKLLALSDLHSGQNVLANLETLLSKEKFDLAIIPGDITNPNSNALDYVTTLANIFTKFNLPWLCVHGNNDGYANEYAFKAKNDSSQAKIFKRADVYKKALSGEAFGNLQPEESFCSQNDICRHTHGEVINFLRQNHLDVHYEPRQINSYTFMGIGGWGDEFPPYELKLDQKTIFITHIPPHANQHSQLPTPNSQPLLHLSGHRHDWEKFYDIGSTRVVNVPSIKFSNRATIITLPEREVTFFTLPQKSLLES